MSEEAQAPTAPAEGPLSADQAVSLLQAKREAPAPADDAPVAEHTQPDPPAEPTADDAQPDPETDNDAAEQEAQPEPETPAIEPPRFWDAEAKAKFRELSPEHQAIVHAQAENGVRASAKAIQEASERAKAAEQQVQGINALAKELAEFLPQATETFKSRWEGVDWLQLANDDPGVYVAYKAQQDAERAQLERVELANQKAQQEARAAFQRQESAALATLAPELADPVKGPVERAKLASFLKDRGASDEDLAGLSALAASVAYDAMRYREAKAKPLTPAQKPAAPPVRVVPPTAATAAPPQRREADTLSRRLSQTGSPEDAIALLRARRKG